MTVFPLKARLFAAGAIALALAACNDKVRTDAPQPLAVLDAAGPLPYAPPAPVERYKPEAGYRWAERAYGVQRAVHETPPDYRFAYGEDEPLAWDTADDWSVYAEPWNDDYRYYYYEPGVDYPYFVRDDDYGYGFNRGGVLVAVVDSRGRYLPAEDFRRVAPLAGRYYARGRALRAAGLHARRIEVDERAWAAQAPRVSRSAERWLTTAREDSDWRRWREADRGRELDRFSGEQLRRAEAQRVRAERHARQDVQRDRADRRLDQAQARAAELNAREAQARQADIRQDRRAEAERRQQAQAQAQAERERRDHDQRAERERARVHQAAQAARQRHGQEQAQQAREHQAQAQAEQQRREAHQAQQAHKAQQAQTRAAEHARGAEQAARQAAAHERAGPKPQNAADAVRADEHGKGRGKGEDKGRGRDKKD